MLQEISEKGGITAFQLLSSMVPRNMPFGEAMISSFGRGMQWKATLRELIPLRKQALTALDRKEAMAGHGWPGLG